MRTRLRAMPTLTGTAPPFDLGALPDDPTDLFVTWLDEAVAAGVPEPHAVTVATADARGRPSSRVVALKDVLDGAWVFATDARSRKGADLEVNPQAAASFYWPAQARQIRLDGPVVRRGAQESAADFLARPPAARAAAFATRPGEALGGPSEMVEAASRALDRVEREPDAVLAHWALYALEPDTVEFWQGDPDRVHLRIVYRRVGAGWNHELRWP